jgi:hypothetical protein
MIAPEQPQRGWAPLRGARDQYLYFGIEKLGSIQQEQQLQITHMVACMGTVLWTLERELAAH